MYVCTSHEVHTPTYVPTTYVLIIIFIRTQQKSTDVDRYGTIPYHTIPGRNKNESLLLSLLSLQHIRNAHSKLSKRTNYYPNYFLNLLQINTWMKPMTNKQDQTSQLLFFLLTKCTYLAQMNMADTTETTIDARVNPSLDETEKPDDGAPYVAP